MNIVSGVRYRCPKCGLSEIEAEAVARVYMWATDDRQSTCVETLCEGVEELRDCKRCSCVNCGAQGYLYQWEITDDK